MSDETVMQAGDRQGDRGLPEWRTDTFISARGLAREGEDSIAKHALTYALDVAEKACRERDAARAEVERLRAERDEARDELDAVESDRHLLAYAIHEYVRGISEVDELIAAYHSMPGHVRAVVEAVNRGGDNERE